LKFFAVSCCYLASLKAEDGMNGVWDYGYQTNFGFWRPIPLDYAANLTFENLVILLC